AQRLDYEPQVEAVRDLDHWLYELQWQPVEQAGSNETTGNWVIFADQGGVGEALAANLENQGASCVLIFQGEKQQQLRERVFVVQPAQLEELQQTLSSILESSDSACRGVVYLWGKNILPAPPDNTEAIESGQLHSCGSLLHLVHELVARKWHEKPRLW